MLFFVVNPTAYSVTVRITQHTDTLTIAKIANDLIEHVNHNCFIMHGFIVAIDINKEVHTNSPLGYHFQSTSLTPSHCLISSAMASASHSYHLAGSSTSSSTSKIIFIV